MSKFCFASVSDLLGASEGTRYIPVKDLISFKNHPFKVVDDAKMSELIESINKSGVLTPILVRATSGNDCQKFEIISGHRRAHAAAAAGIKEIPAIVKDMTDDEAVIWMVDSNIQREKILPSEKAWALRLKLEAVKRQGKRNDLTSGNDCQKLEIGEEFGLKDRQVRNYIRLTYLLPELLNLVDLDKLVFLTAVEISFFTEASQNIICQYLKEHKLSTKDVKKLRAVAAEPLTSEAINTLLKRKAPAKRSFVLKEKTIRKYFPEDFSEEQIEETVMGLIKEWRKEHDQESNL